MRVHYLIITQLLFFSLFASVSFCKTTVADDHVVRTPFQVVGSANCADCKKNNFKSSQAFSGLHVSIDCKLNNNGDMKRVAIAELNEQGQFKVWLPKEMVHKNGQNLKQECYAQLHNAVAMPCPTPTTKIMFKSPHTFAPSKPLHFSPTLCTSKFFWPYFNHPWFNHPWFRTPPVVYSPPVYTPPVVMPQPPETGPLPPPINTQPPMEQPLPPPPMPMDLPPPGPVNNPPQQPCPPTQPLPPAANEPPVEPLPPPANEPPVEPLPPPTVPTYVPHPFFKHPKNPWPPIYGHQ